MTTHSPLLRRRGLTLTEALVAMFVAAIGMISLMALFPLGALQMGQALKDSRCTETATNAEALMRAHWRIEMWEKGNDAGIVSAFGSLGGLSDPVFVDPIGVRASVPAPSVNGPLVAGVASLTRISLTQLSNPAIGADSRTFRFCSLLDDMTFDESGAPVVTGSRVERSGRYNWMAVLQRPNNTIATYESKLTILVFDGRAAGYVAPGSELVYGDASFPARVHTFIAGGSTLQLRFPSTDPRPTVGKGRWVALFTPANKLLTFHRIVSVADADAAGTTTFDIELQSPIPSGTATSLGHDPANCRAIVLAGLAEVFERAPLTGQ